MSYEKINIVPSEFVIIGGMGNLSKNKILPALFWRFLDKQIDINSNIILCDTNVKNYIRFISELETVCGDAVKSHDKNKKYWQKFIKIISFVELNVVSGKGDFELINILKQKLNKNR